MRLRTTFIALLAFTWLALSQSVTAQSVFSSTTLTAAVAVGQNQITVAATTNMVVGHVVLIEHEAMRISSIGPGLNVRVQRGTDGTSAVAHASGTLVYFGTADSFGPLETIRNAFVVRSDDFNIDNGAGVTLDNPIVFPRPARVWGCWITYAETAGTVAAGNARIGTSVGGAQVVAADAYTNSATAGTIEQMVLLRTSIPQGALHIRHTGVAVTAAGVAHVQCSVSYQ